MIDIHSETLLTMGQAASTLPNRPSITTMWRWRLRGVRGVKLDTITIGGRRFTSSEALERFIEQSTAAADGLPLPTRTNRQREAAIRRAERELRELGV